MRGIRCVHLSLSVGLATGRRAARINVLRGSEPIEFSGDEYKGKYELDRSSIQSYMKSALRGSYVNRDTR